MIYGGVLVAQVKCLLIITLILRKDSLLLSLCKKYYYMQVNRRLRI